MKLLKKWVLLLLAGLLLSLTACGREAPPPPEGTIPVTVSFGAMEKLTKAIGGSAVSITVMVPDGTEPHDFEPRAEDMVKLSRSRLFVYNGMGMEHWAEKAIRGAASPGLITVDASARVAPILLTDEEERGEGKCLAGRPEGQRDVRPDPCRIAHGEGQRRNVRRRHEAPAA